MNRRRTLVKGLGYQSRTWAKKSSRNDYLYFHDHYLCPRCEFQYAREKGKKPSLCPKCKSSKQKLLTLKEVNLALYDIHLTGSDLF